MFLAVMRTGEFRAIWGSLETMQIHCTSTGWKEFLVPTFQQRIQDLILNEGDLPPLISGKFTLKNSNNLKSTLLANSLVDLGIVAPLEQNLRKLSLLFASPLIIYSHCLEKGEKRRA